ncbi:MAG: hypothetical protein KAI57_03475 [Candidatus Pacebacteria bacterium]|nr:hypothetical protein [Candidatus Paceibacterota bacterium]
MTKISLKKFISTTLLLMILVISSVSVILPVEKVMAACVVGDNDGDGVPCDPGEDAVNCPADCAWAAPVSPANVPNDFTAAIVNMTNWILGFVTLIAVLMIIWGGVLYLTSAGDDSRAENGKKTITYALIGLVVAGFAYAIVQVIVVTIL